MSDPKPTSVPAQALAYLTIARRWFSTLSRPARTMFVVTSTLAVLFGSLVAFERANEPYAALFSQLDTEDASAIVAKLKELKVPFRIEADGSTVEVPESKLRELRLELAGGGLPHGGGVGFESFDKMRLGATDFEQRVLYRRALEGELTRTIATIGAVQSSRVHLVLPEKSVFVTRSEPASASIVLRLHPGRSLGSSEVASIVHLVAAAVPALEPDHISVVTTDGITLHRPHKTTGGEEELGGEDDVHAVARSYESAVEDRVRAMLEKVVGPGHADVRVTAEIDSARVERLEEHFDPAKSVLRSEEQSIEHAEGTSPEQSLAGVPGAESNLPGGSAKGASAPPKPAASAAASASASASAAAATPPPPAAVASGSVRESHTRNFEIDHVSEKRISNGGSLHRLTVAVVLDGSKDAKGGAPRTPEDLAKLATLVRSAAGASDARGDIVTVESMPFAESIDVALDATAAAPAPMTRIQMAKRWGPYAAGAVVVLLVLGVALKRGRSAASAAATGSALTSGAPVPNVIEAAIRPALDSGDLRTRAHARASQDPATAALVLRFWLGTSTPDPRESVKA